MNTPLLLIHFNRPDITRRQIESLKTVRPRRIWVLCDGPRPDREGEAEKVAEVRRLLDRLPWECDVKRLYRDANFGCFRNISNGITWFMEDCERGIILEDDCLAHPSFFPYCAELLERYADDPTVFAISGHHRCPQPLPIPGDYGFSNYFDCWGWATWRDKWRKFDSEMTGWTDRRKWRRVRRRMPHVRARLYWGSIFSRVYSGRRDSWAYRYLLTIWKEGGKAVIPAANLTTNVGFSEDATNTAHFQGMEVEAEAVTFPLNHPPTTEVDPVIDRWFEDGIHSKSFPVRVRWGLRKVAGLIRPRHVQRTACCTR